MAAAETAKALEQIEDAGIQADQPKRGGSDEACVTGGRGDLFRARLQIARHEGLPELLAQAEQQDRQQHKPDGTVKGQESRQACIVGRHGGIVGGAGRDFAHGATVVTSADFIIAQQLLTRR
jgi:hypothetical protein